MCLWVEKKHVSPSGTSMRGHISLPLQKIWIIVIIIIIIVITIMMHFIYKTLFIRKSQRYRQNKGKPVGTNTIKT